MAPLSSTTCSDDPSRWRCLAASAAAALIAFALAGCDSVSPSATHVQSTAAIWFHPLPPGSQGADGNPAGGSADFPSLFEPNAPWPRALAETRVFGLYAGWVLTASDQDLQTLVAFLNAHHVGIELEAPALQALPTCGDGVEGYVPYGTSLQTMTLAYLQRLQTLGAEVGFVKFDEPYYFGSVVDDPRSCHWSVTEVATQVAQFVQLVHSVYPNAAVGDVEPVIDSAYTPDAVSALGQWHDSYQSVAGASLPFFIADMDFSNPAWPALAKALEGATRQRGMQFGIIYIGDPQDASDAEWTGKVSARFQAYQGQHQGQPDFVLFQSWEVHPTACLPETDPTTFTGVIDRYIAMGMPSM